MKQIQSKTDLAAGLRHLLIFGLILVFSNGVQSQNIFSLQFDGVDDYVESASNTGAVFSNGGAIYCNFKTSVISANDIYLVSQYGHQIFGTSNAVFELSIRNGNLVALIRDSSGTDNTMISSGINLSDNKWHEVGMAYFPANDSITLLIDGMIQSVGGLPNLGTINSPNPIMVGRHWNPNFPWYFTGLIDEVKVWNSPIDFTVYEHCDSSSLSNCILYYNFEEGTGTSTSDQTSSNNHGQLKNGVIWSTNVFPFACCKIPNYDPFSDSISICGDSVIIDAGSWSTFAWIQETLSRLFMWIRLGSIQFL